MFEVVLALAIFAISLAAIGQMMSTGVRGAVQARLQSQAVLRSQSKLAEVVAGITPFQTVNKAAFADDSAWTWSMAVNPAPQTNLYTLELTVEHASAEAAGNVAFTLRRMARDPQLARLALEEEAQAAAQTGSSSSSSQSGSTGSKTGTSGAGSSGASSGSSSSGSGSASSGASSKGAGTSGASSKSAGSSGVSSKSAMPSGASSKGSASSKGGGT